MVQEAEDAFDDLRLELAPLDGVDEGRMFHCDGLSYHGKFFAALGKEGETMLVKLPEDRVNALIADGTGIPFDANKGRPMREWMLVPAVSLDRWPAIAHEALTFAQSLANAKAGRPKAKR